MKRVLILGASGFIGSNLSLALRDTFRVFGTFNGFRPRVDRVPFIRFPLAPASPLKELLDLTKPDAIVYCAGLSQIKPCLENPLGALYLNAEAPAALASLMAQRGGQFIYFSTPKVFSGEQGGYREENPVSAQSIYGKTKARGEEMLRTYPNACILRLGSIFGMGSFRRESIFNRVLQSLQAGREMKLITDEYRTFYGVENVTRAVKSILGVGSDFGGLYHLGNGKRDSYYTFGKTLAEVFDYPVEKLIPIPSAGFGESGEPRGRDTTLQGVLFARRFGWEVPDLRASLETLRQRLRAGTQ